MIFSALTPPPVTRAVCLLLSLTGFLPAAQAAFETAEITFGEYNCAACHPAGPAVEKRLASRPSPRLGRDGARLSPAWIRAFLIKPTAETPATMMPDMLHALPAAEKAEAAEDLTHYLVSLQNQAIVPGIAFDSAMANAGKELFHTVGCVACHAPRELPANGEQPPAGKAEIAEPAKNSVMLGDLGKKFGVNELAAFLRDPLKTRPGGRMPAQRLTEREARAVAMYLLREQAQPDPGVKMPGLSYEYYEGAFDKLPEFAKLKPTSSGHTDHFTLRAGPQKNSMALRFHGLLIVPRNGEYSFWIDSDDGSQLFVDDKLVVDNDGAHATAERGGKARLTAGDHTILVTYFDQAGEKELKVFWAGPGFPRQEIPGAALWSGMGGEVMRPTGPDSFTVDNTRAAKGRALFERFNCAACHEIDQPGRKAAPLDQLAAEEKGCLAPNPPEAAPDFSLDGNRRKELTALLANRAGLAPRWPPPSRFGAR